MKLEYADKKYYQDDFGTDEFTIIVSDDLSIPKPQQIKYSNNLAKPLEITWTYLQPRTIAKIIIDSVLIKVLK